MVHRQVVDWASPLWNGVEWKSLHNGGLPWILARRTTKITQAQDSPTRAVIIIYCCEGVTEDMISIIYFRRIAKEWNGNAWNTEYGMIAEKSHMSKICAKV